MTGSRDKNIFGVKYPGGPTKSCLGYILSYCDHDTRRRAALASRCFSAALAESETSVNTSDINDNIVSLDCLPFDVLLTLFK